MNAWRIAAILIAVLLLVGAAGAVKPVRGPMDKVIFVHYKDAAVKPSPAPDQTTGFKLMGMKWASFPVTYHVDPAGSGLVSDAVHAEFSKAFDAWDSVSEGVVFIRGEPMTPGAADGKNDVSFALLPETNVIAVTTVWYYTISKEIAEADIQMNTRMPWGIDADGEGGGSISPRSAYDVRNIATHEIGHVCGLADLYTSRSRELTMYGYGAKEEVKKDSLAAGDKAGLVKLYGA